MWVFLPIWWNALPSVIRRCRSLTKSEIMTPSGALKVVMYTCFVKWMLSENEMQQLQQWE